MKTSGTSRFSDRVSNYVRYRPAYPPEIIPFLEKSCGLNQNSVIADIGSGTGILTQLFLDYGNKVYGIEPNADMRTAAEEAFKGNQHFISLDSTAENTTLEAGSIDLVVAGQAFHWFDVYKSKLEFKRILRPSGYVVLIWNERVNEASEFLKGYEAMLLRYSDDYAEVDHKNTNEEVMDVFYGKNRYCLTLFENHQDFDFEGIKGRLLSSSYAPAEGHANHVPMMNTLKELFKRFQSGGKVRFQYVTKVFLGQL